MSEAIGIAILAAGASTRFGSLKQLAKYDGQPLVRRAAAEAISVQNTDVAVIIGARAREVSGCLDGLCVTVLLNNGWTEGLSSSVRHAAEWSLRQRHTGLLLMACDQVRVQSEHLAAIIEAAIECGAQLSAASYGGTVGIPAYFRQALLTQLLSLSGDRGAKPIIEANRATAVFVSTPAAAFDVDYKEQLVST